MAHGKTADALAAVPAERLITLAHGEGGELSRRLIREEILAALGNEILAPLDDAARLPPVGGRIAISTDSYVVTPLFFPGGDIGSLAVYGTVNDLAVSGARPLWLTLGMILEDGFPEPTLRAVLASVAEAARQAGVRIVAGDTKVVPRGAADGLFLNTTGIGVWREEIPAGPAALRPGDRLVVSGPIARHGIAVLAARETLAFEPPPRSDSAPLVEICRALCEGLGGSLRALRDATRGGVAAVLHEWAEACGATIRADESAVPLTAEVRGACELLGLDPLHIANEGTLVAAVEPAAADRALAILHRDPRHRQAACFAEVVPRGLFPVTISRTLGVEQPLESPLGAPLPRIC